MILLKSIPTIITTLFLSMILFGQSTKPIEYLDIKEPIIFDSIAYHLTWSSHPTDRYYKQEYLAKGDTISKFNKLILFEVITGEIKLEDIISIKVAELKKMKETNPIINYNIYIKNEEIMLDFLLSENASDGENLSIVERNIYRYKVIKKTNGQKYILLFGVSERAYDNDIDNFLLKLKENKFNLIKSVGIFPLPEISIKK